MKEENPTEEIERFLDHARKSGHFDTLRSSAFVMAYDVELAKERGNLQMALQIGAALLWEKPFLLVQRYGEKIPQRLRYFADEIVEFEEGDFHNPTNQAKMSAAIARMTERVLAKERRDAERSR